MTPRQLKRLEDLLRLGMDQSTTQKERDSALDEALREVIAVRNGTSEHEWTLLVAMQFGKCSLCGEGISPAKRIWKNENQELRHDKCHREKERDL